MSAQEPQLGKSGILLLPDSQDLDDVGLSLKGQKPSIPFLRFCRLSCSFFLLHDIGLGKNFIAVEPRTLTVYLS